ncbi:MAG: hypothetical protein JO084_18910 [Bradyrhizobiaceae bacterium]|nr:hypothetical protein [Bradyrhizobiaceae bacterium]
MRALIPAALAACALAMGVPAAAGPVAVNTAIQNVAASDVVTVAASRRKQPRRAYVDVPVRPRVLGSAPECPGLTSWNPANPDRGFCDPGFAYHGNVNGCAIDLGYGRWAPCSTGR